MDSVGRIERPGTRLCSRDRRRYERTVYLDSDTFACRDPSKLFDILADVDVACVWGGRGNHSGASAGVLA